MTCAIFCISTTGHGLDLILSTLWRYAAPWHPNSIVVKSHSVLVPHCYIFCSNIATLSSVQIQICINVTSCEIVPWLYGCICKCKIYTTIYPHQPLEMWRWTTPYYRWFDFLSWSADWFHSNVAAVTTYVFCNANDRISRKELKRILVYSLTKIITICLSLGCFSLSTTSANSFLRLDFEVYNHPWPGPNFFKANIQYCV